MHHLSKTVQVLFHIILALAYCIDGFLTNHPTIRLKSMQLHPSSRTTTTTTTTSIDDELSFRLGYVTDVEGNIDYFLSYVQKSNVLDLHEWDTKVMKLGLRDEHCYFVFGGDAVDKGPGDIRLVRALVDLKQRYPNRVFLLVGNRDLNKLRFTAELAKDDMNRPMEDIPPPHWDPKAPSYLQYLERILGTEESENRISLESLNTRVRRLCYMLEHTLGCPNTFEFRRQELCILQERSDITDDEVVDSFVHEVEEGSLRQYLSNAHVAVVIGNTLFCHGAVDRNTMRFIPSANTKFENPESRPPPAKLATTVEEWVNDLNTYLETGLKDHRKRPYWNNDRTSRGGESLLALQNRPAMWGRSVVSNCYGDGGCITTKHAALKRNNPERVSMEDTNPLVFEAVSSDPMDPVVAKWLLEHGIQRVVVGHKPTGDCPSVLSAIHTGVEIVSADTSFSDTSATDNRGCATSIVELAGTSHCDNQLHLSGILRDGTPYRSAFHRLHSGGAIDTNVGDPFLGRQLPDGWWVKASSHDEKHYWLTRGKGRIVEYKQVEKSNLPNLMFSRKLEADTAN